MKVYKYKDVIKNIVFIALSAIILVQWAISLFVNLYLGSNFIGN